MSARTGGQVARIGQPLLLWPIQFFSALAPLNFIYHDPSLCAAPKSGEALSAERRKARTLCRRTRAASLTRRSNLSRRRLWRKQRQQQMVDAASAGDVDGAPKTTAGQLLAQWRTGQPNSDRPSSARARASLKCWLAMAPLCSSNGKRGVGVCAFAATKAAPAALGRGRRATFGRRRQRASQPGRQADGQASINM